jgi:large subunit ribosomal protein L25
MRKDITIAAEPRATRGKNAAHRVRAAAQVPAIVYGTGGDPVAISVNPKEMSKILRSTTAQNTIFNLAITGGENAPVMIAAWQNEPLKGTLLHVDLKRVDLSKRLTVRIPVHTNGEPKGVKLQGGLHEVITRDITIECLPDEIPEVFEVEVGELMIGQSIRAGQLPLTGSMKLISSPEQVISHVVAMRVVVEATPEAAAAVPGAAAATAAEPEVIKKGKKEEEGAEADAKDKKKK